MWLLLSSLKFRSAQTAQVLPAGKTNLSRAKSSTAIGRIRGWSNGGYILYEILRKVQHVVAFLPYQPGTHGDEV
jgi:hypothetical protein